MRKVGDLVLIYYMGKPSVYARIEAIEPDEKDGWYRVELLVLSIPAQYVKWILKEEYIDGDTFTMGGIPLRLADIKMEPTLKLLNKLGQGSKQESKGYKDKKKNIKKQNSSKVIDLRKHKKDT
ncbi:MAG: hypothetical protein DRG39_04695 [Deltaproteobacteria bacterium]|nr:MAG: hypothetical protein DRG39_04695 [Deltaproteobacteria bacterium]